MNDTGQNFAAKIASAFTYNKPLSILILIAVVVAGIVAFWMTPKQYNPEIERPAFRVVVEYPGARAEEVEQYVTKELVEKISELGGVDEVTAQSMAGGRSVATVLFYVGEDLERAKVRLFTQIEENLDLRKGSIQQPQITNIDPDDVPIVSIALRSETKTHNEVRRAAVSIMNQLKQLENTANLRVHGAQPRALTVTIDTQSMRARNVAVTDVQQAIEATNIKQVHDDITDGERRIQLETDGTIKTVADARTIVVRPGVYLSDVATVSDAYAETDSYVTYAEGDENSAQHEAAVYVSVAKQDTANAPTVAKDVREQLNKIMKQDQYRGLTATIVRDDGAVASAEIWKLGTNLLISIAIVGAVLLIFLSLRPALVVMTAIPLTLMLVFSVGYFFDQTINRITLFALILSLGLLVDSATVVVENIYRHLQGGENDRRKSIISAVHQVGVGLFLSTVTSVVVFIPMLFITGMMGPYMGPVAFFVPVALIMSLAVAFVITPFLAHMILRERSESRSKQDRDLFAPLVRAYERFQRSVLYNRRKQNLILASLGVVLLAVLSFPILKLVHFQMLPKADKQEYYAYLDMPDGTGVKQTRIVSNEISDVIYKNQYTDSIQSFIGEPPIINFSGLFRGADLRGGPHQATLRVNLIPQDERGPGSALIVSDIRKQVKKSVSLSDSATLRFVEIPPGPPVRSTFEAEVKNGSRANREALAERIADIAANTRGAVDIDTSIVNAYPRIVTDVETNKALSHGISPDRVAQTLDIIAGPRIVGQYHPTNQEEFAPITVGVSRFNRDTPADFRRIDVRSERGVLVPLSSVTEHRYSRNVPVIYSDGFAPTTRVSGEVDQRSIVYVMIDVIRQILVRADTSEIGDIISWDLYGMEWQAPSGEILDIEWGGEWELTLDNFRDLGMAMIIAFFTVYVILVAQYRSFLVPVLVMATVPFGLVGILPGFAVLDAAARIPLTATALIGFIALIGIVVNNAIIYLEYVTQLRTEGVDEREALIEAGKVRMRPIILTSMTTVLATLTIALDPVWSGLAWSVVFGLSLSAFMTLGIFPILYTRLYVR